MNKLYFILIAFILFWSACARDIIDDGSNDPVFYMHMEELDGDSLNMTAGVGGIYLFTDVKQDSANVIQMSGLFADVDCPNDTCANTVRFTFRNNSQENSIVFDGLFTGDSSWDYSLGIQPPNYRTVAIQWIKPDGSICRSDLISQDTIANYFHVGAPDLYEANEKGQPTIKMNVQFSCKMWDPSNLKVRQVSGNGVIGIAYQ